MLRRDFLKTAMATAVVTAVFPPSGSYPPARYFLVNGVTVPNRIAG
jgi:hypothetical protein